jgi:hypothetical protein
MEIRLNGLPKTPNGSHGHWRSAAGERKKWRTAVYMTAFFKRPPEPLKKAILTCIRFSSVEPDQDNLAASFKGCIDGLKDAGIIVDDKSSCVVKRTYLWMKAPPKEGSVKICVEAA